MTHECMSWKVWRCRTPTIPSSDGEPKKSMVDLLRVKLKISIGFCQCAHPLRVCRNWHSLRR